MILANSKSGFSVNDFRWPVILGVGIYFKSSSFFLTRRLNFDLRDIAICVVLGSFPFFLKTDKRQLSYRVDSSQSRSPPKSGLGLFIRCISKSVRPRTLFEFLIYHPLIFLIFDLMFH